MPFFWLILFVLILVKREYLYIYLRIICIFIYISLTPFFSNILELPLLSKTNNFEKLEKYSYVLVPTAGVYKDFQSKWHPSSNTLMRVSQGEKIAKKLNIPLIISGGNLNNQGIFLSDLSLTPSCLLNLCIPQVGLLIQEILLCLRS